MNVHTADIKRDDQKRFAANSVSFDVFDTFLLRACTSSEGVYRRAFELSALSELFPDASVSFVEHRKQAEARARKHALQSRDSVEVGISEIYHYFPFRLFRLSRTALPDLVRAEFQAELDLCRVDPDVLARYQELQAAGARVGFISDTYWSKSQLGELLRHCGPGLQWDFLYASSECGTNKGDGLFAKYLAEQCVSPAHAVHIGDNLIADIEGAERHGIAAVHRPQASTAQASIFNRETALERLLVQSRMHELDGGVRTLRRLVASRVPVTSPAFGLGLNVLGSVMHAFDAFIDDRVAAIDSGDGKTCVAFLGRDGFLSHRTWTQRHQRPAPYLEINRRVSVMAAADTLDPLVDLLRNIPDLDAAVFADLVKCLPPRVKAFFSSHPRGIASGRAVAEALPGLIPGDEITALSRELRAELMRYLRKQIPDLDRCRDIVLVDLGYSGSIQKALRRVFDIEGLDIRLHGLYLLTLDDGFHECDDNDTYEGLISDIVVSAHTKRMLLRNIALLEQICCAPTGSVRGYRNGDVVYEDDPKPEHQAVLAREVQDGIAAYADAASQLAPALRLASAENTGLLAGAAAVTLGRLLLLPTDDELSLLGSLQHDVNLGTVTLTPLLDHQVLGALEVARSLPDACIAPNPPMWLAGSFAALSPAHSFLYALFGANLLPSDIFGDVKCTDIDVVLVDAKGGRNTVSVACYRTGFGELRVRIPMTYGMAIRAIEVPVPRLAKHGKIRGPFLQSGGNVRKALASGDILVLEHPRVRYRGLAGADRSYTATEEDGALLIEMPAQTAPVTVVSIGLVALDENRILVSE